MPETSLGEIKISFATVIIIICLVATAVAVYWIQTEEISPMPQAVIKSNMTADWLVYKNENFRFEFKYPPEWKVQIKQEGAKNIIELVNPEKPAENYAVASVTFLPSLGVTLDKWWETAVQNSKYEKIGETTIAGRQALKLKVLDSDVQPRYVFINEDNGGFIFGIYVDGVDQMTVDNILGSFKLN